MKKCIAVILFYDWTIKSEQTKKILRIQRFARRERLPIVEDIFECIAGTPIFCSIGQFEEESIPFSHPMCEHRYSLVVSAPNLVKMHELLSLLEAYAAYCGIHSRLFSLKEE